MLKNLKKTNFFTILSKNQKNNSTFFKKVEKIIHQSTKLTLKNGTHGIINRINLNLDSIQLKIDKDDIVQYILENIIKPNSLNLITTPTEKVKTDDYSKLEPGHNFPVITDNENKIIYTMSIRPNTTESVGTVKALSDPRIKADNIIKLYRPLYTSIEDEIIKWINLALRNQNYSMFIHTIPLETGLVDKEEFGKNVEKIIAQNTPYSLLSHQQENGTFKKAHNCNSGSGQAIFGTFEWRAMEDYDRYDDSTQKIAYEIMTKKFVKNKEEYLEIITKLGLKDNIFFDTPQLTNTDSENFLSSFTC
jgi:hypothetical protein